MILETLVFLASSLTAAPAVHGAAAQPLQVAGPTLGLFFDQRSKELLPVWGVAGSGRIGEPLAGELALLDVEVSPNQRSGVALSRDGGVYAVRLDSSGVSVERLTELVGGKRVALSPSGSSAAVYSPQSKRALKVMDLDSAPEVESVDLTAAPGAITALAINDSGDALLVASREGQSGVLSVFGPDRAPQPIGPIGRVSSLSFIAGSDDAVIADYGRNEILHLRDVTGVAQTAVIASEQDGVRQPIAAIAIDGKAYAISPSLSGVIEIPLNGGAVDVIPCKCRPTTLTRMNGALLLTRDPSSPLILADLASAKPRTFFVPSRPDQGGSRRPLRARQRREGIAPADGP